MAFDERTSALLSEFRVDLAQFTEPEQTCIGRKIKKLRDEGKSQDQAIAIAISTCAPSKSQNALKAMNNAMTFDPEKMLDRERVKIDNRLPGGEYESFQNADGTWDIFDVPIIANRPVPLMSGEMFEITKEWQESAVNKALLKWHRDNYAPPLRLRHDRGFENRPTGKLLLKEVRLGTFEGEEAYITYSDFVAVPDDIYQRIRRGELSYLSAEMQDINNHEINAVALLPDEEPFFRFAMINIGVENRIAEGYPVGQAVPLSRDALTIASRAFGNSGVCMLSRFALTLQQENTGMEDEKKKDEAELMDEEYDMDDKKADLQATEDGLKTDAIATMIAKAMGAIHDALAPLMELSETLSGKDEAVESPEEEAIEETVEEEIPVSLKSSATTEATKTAIALQAELAKRDDRIANLEKKEKLATKIAEAQVKLRRYGVDDVKVATRVTDVFEQHGAEGVDLWLSAYVADRTEDPPEDMDAIFGSSIESDPELSEFANASHLTRERASNLSTIYDRSGGHRVLKVDKKTYIKDNLVADSLNGSRA